MRRRWSCLLKQSPCFPLGPLTGDVPAAVLCSCVRVFTGLLCRWVTIADYVNLHAPGAGKTAKQVTKIVKSLQRSGTVGVYA